jgi:hypothetical protein
MGLLDLTHASASEVMVTAAATYAHTYYPHWRLPVVSLA